MSTAKTSTSSSDAVPHYLLLAAGSLLFALLGLFGLWLGCFYLSGAAAAGGFGGSRAGMGKSARLGSDEEEEEEDSVCTEEGSVLTLPSPHVMTLIKK